MKEIALCWSSGKDSAWALSVLRQQRDVRVAALITSFNGHFNRVAMHGVRRNLVEAQAERVGVPLWPVELPWPCSNEVYERRMGVAFDRAVAEGLSGVAFGDLYLQDVRDYRVRMLEGTGLEPIFPVWGMPTRELAETILDAGVRAKLVCVDPKKLPLSFAGRAFDRALLADLPAGVDACGENGEFHTFVYDGPGFSSPLNIHVGDVVERDGFVFADLLAETERAPGV